MADQRLVPDLSLLSPSQPEQISQYPGTDHLAEFACAPGLTRIVIQRGVEDNYSPSGFEPAQLREKLLDNGYFRSLSGFEGFRDVRRNYDQAGLDLHLIDQFEIPRGIVSGELIFSARQIGPGNNDAVTIGDFDSSSRAMRSNGSITFHVPVGSKANGLADEGERIDGFYVFDFEQLYGATESPFQGDFLEFLNGQDRPDSIDFGVVDDTQVDFAALLLCQQPTEARGLTFREFRLKPYGSEISIFSCQDDVIEPVCNPMAGDQLCSTPTPITCYLEGNRTVPNDIALEPGHRSTFVGGEIRLSQAIRGTEMATLNDADAVCRTEFGEDWRVLSFHEAGGHRAVSLSDIEVGRRGFVHIADQAYANCWDRPESVIIE